MAVPFEEHSTIEGDTVDLIAYRRFGRLADQVERILEFNPGLAELGPILPVGTIVKVPVPETKGRKTLRRLWD